MANVDSPFGFRAIRYRSGAPYNGACNRYICPASDSTALFIGDAVSAPTTQGFGANGEPYITQSAAGGEKSLGVVVAFEPATNASTVYRAASTERYALVADDIQNLIFEVQCSGYMTATQNMNYADITVGTGSTITGLSAMELDSSTTATTAATLRIVRPSTKPSNGWGTSTTDANSLNTVVEVFFNETGWHHL